MPFNDSCSLKLVHPFHNKPRWYMVGHLFAVLATLLRNLNPIWWTLAFNSLIIMNLRTTTTFKGSSDCDRQSRIFQDIFLTFSPRISWHLIGSILASKNWDASRSKAAPLHQWTTAMPHCRQDVFLQLIHKPEKLQFCSITPQNRIPKLLWRMDMILSVLKSMLLVLLGQGSGIEAFNIYYAPYLQTETPLTSLEPSGVNSFLSLPCKCIVSHRSFNFEIANTTSNSISQNI